jgi:hypothetical protein
MAPNVRLRFETLFWDGPIYFRVTGLWLRETKKNTGNEKTHRTALVDASLDGSLTQGPQSSGRISGTVVAATTSTGCG